jgi:ketosteroid isomerase-like protein
MQTNNIARVEDVYRAFANADWTRVVSAFSEDVTWTQPGTTRLSGVHQGRDAVVEFFLDIAQYGLFIRPIEFFGEEDRVVAVVDVELAGERAHEVDRFVVRDGLIISVEHIGDTEMLSRALREPAPFS